MKARSKKSRLTRVGERSSKLALRERLRDAGLRATAPRLAVLQHLEAARGPLSHAEVADHLAVDGLDRATIYRNLIDLTERGLLRRNDLGDHVWRFELARAESADHRVDHPHFVCSECGAVACLPEETVVVRTTRSTPAALKRRQSVQVQLRGRCDSCS